MNSTLTINRALTRLLPGFLLACGLAATCAAASADVNRCIERDGRILITDVPCSDARVIMTSDQQAPQASRDAIPLSPGAARLLSTSDGGSDDGVSDSAAAGIAINSGGLPAALEIRSYRSAWADLPHPLRRRSVGLDASTLQAARVNMQMQDQLRHQQRVAGR